MPLRSAITKGHIRCVEQLLAAKADVNALDERDIGALYCAAAYNQGQIVEALLAAGADPNTRCDTGKTPSGVAAQLGSLESLMLLVAADADITTPNNAGTTPLKFARNGRHAKCAAALAIATSQDIVASDDTEPLAAAQSDVLLNALPAAFAHSASAAFGQATSLAASFRSTARFIMKTDARGGAHLNDAALLVQQVLVGLLTALDSSELASLVLPSGGGTVLLDDALRNDCKEVLAYKGVQEACAITGAWCRRPRSCDLPNGSSIARRNRTLAGTGRDGRCSARCLRLPPLSSTPAVPSTGYSTCCCSCRLLSTRPSRM
jgi:hypothetical protein